MPSPWDDLLESAPPQVPAEVDGVDVDSAYEALTMLTCPWRLRIGICATGCREEPACETNEPDGGWAKALREAVGHD